MSRLNPEDEFTDEVFTRDRRTWWANFADVPGVNVCSDERLTVDEAYARYLPWEVEKLELFVKGTPTRLINPVGVEPIDAYTDTDLIGVNVFAHRRSDTGAILGTSSKVFTVLQESEVAAMVAAALEGSKYAVASIGALKHGAVTFCSVDFEEMGDINTSGQVIHPYLSVVNYHDGKGGLKAYGSGVRPECMNTINLGWLAGVQLGSITHTTRAHDRVPAMQAEIRRYLDLVPRAERTVGRLINWSVAPNMLRKCIDALTPIPNPDRKDGKVKNQRAVDSAEAKRKKMTELAILDDRVGFTGTAWGLFQAFTTYDQWETGFRHTDRSGLTSREHSTITDHFTGRQAQRETAAMKVILGTLDRSGVDIGKNGLVLT